MYIDPSFLKSHSHIPWKLTSVNKNELFIIARRNENEHDLVILDNIIGNKETLADGYMAVHAVNNFYRLLQTCEFIEKTLTKINKLCNVNSDLIEILERLQLTIKLAKGGNV